MSGLTDLHEDLTLCMNQIAKVMRLYEYNATPTLVLRHKDGSNKSIVIGNDDLKKVVQTINDTQLILKQLKAIVDELKTDLDADE